MKFENYIQELEKEVSEKTAEMALALKIQERFPDVEVHINRWKHKKFVAKSVNSQATDMMLNHNCGCCSDSPLQFSAWVEIDGVKVYGNPVEIFIGQKKVWGYGDELDHDWREKLEKHGFPKALIDRVAVFEDYDEEDEEI